MSVRTEISIPRVQIMHNILTIRSFVFLKSSPRRAKHKLHNKKKISISTLTLLSTLLSPVSQLEVTHLVLEANDCRWVVGSMTSTYEGCVSKNESLIKPVFLTLDNADIVTSMM